MSCQIQKECNLIASLVHQILLRSDHIIEKVVFRLSVTYTFNKGFNFGVQLQRRCDHTGCVAVEMNPSLEQTVDLILKTKSLPFALKHLPLNL